ncbi:MAG: endonuclease [Ferruginibacter sp.]|nr:endonuclease [Ferruginibacter sp.]
MRKIFTVLAFLALSFVGVSQINITDINSTYTQDFNTLATSGTANAITTLPTGWTFLESGSNANTTYAADNGAANGGNTYSYGTTSTSDRAFGTLRSGSLNSTIGVQFTNSTSYTITTITINYTGEQWRLGTTGRADRLDFQYSLNATALNNGTWLDENGLDFSTPNQTTLGALDGNIGINRTVISAITISGLTIAPGAIFWIRWQDFGATAPQDGLSIDDFSMTYTGTIGDNIPPVVTTLIPANNSTNIATSTSNLIMNFNENITLGTGNIVIKRFSDNSVFETINVSTAIVNNATATIPFINPLESGIQYYVEVAAGAFKDVAGNDFAGISGNSTWNFTTIPLPAAGIVENNYSFTNCASTFLTEGWRQYSVIGNLQNWACTTNGHNDPDGIIMSGVTSGVFYQNEDWLISPPFDLTSVIAPTLKFYSKAEFNGNPLELKLLLGYTPGANPNTATQIINLNGAFPNVNTNSWTLSDNIDLSAYNQANVYIAWKYTSTTTTSTRWTIDDVTVYSGIVLPPCDEPTDQPTNLTLTPTATTVNGSFTPVVPAPSDYLVIRSTSATLSATPLDGTAYTVGTALGGGTVIANGSATNFTDNGLTPTTQYYYFVFAYNNENCTGGANYNVTLNSPNGNTNSTTTLALAPCGEPAVAPTNLNLSATNTTISGSFTASATANRYLVVISTTTPLGATPSDGNTYTAGSSLGSGTVVSYGTTTTFNATGLTANTQYYIFVFAANGDCTGEPDYLTTSLDGTITTTNGTGVPAGYYDAAIGLTCQPLKTALKNIISTNTQVLSYTPGLWNLYHFSDKRRNDANTADILWDTYTDIPTGPEIYTFTLGTNQCGSYTNEGDCYNREHSTPQSWFSSASPMVSDAHHIFPTDGKINALHSNYPYGEVQTLFNPSTFNPSTNGSKLGTSPSENYGYTGVVFEPIDEYKGDYARAFLYMAVRYQDEIISQNWSGNSLGNEVYISIADSNDVVFRTLQIYDNWFIKLLYKWHIQDPVSAKEIDRNNVIYSQLVTDGATSKKQGNRNPFVDHPEYVAAIWGPSCLSVLPVTITNLSAKKVSNNAVISWKISNEQSIRKYEIERSSNGITFEKIGEVNSNGNTTYSFVDNSLPKIQRVYYRLRTIELSGKTTVTNIVSVDGNIISSTVKIYPNPAAKFITIELNNAIASEPSLLTITDITGKVVLQRSLTANSSVLRIPVQQLSNGVYTLKIANTSTTTNTKFVIAK